jgi:hypothetical protein
LTPAPSRSAVVSRPDFPLVQSASHPCPHRRLRQIQIAGHGTCGLTFIENKPNHARLELIRELAPCSVPLVLGHAGHRIRLRMMSTKPGQGQTPPFPHTRTGISRSSIPPFPAWPCAHLSSGPATDRTGLPNLTQFLETNDQLVVMPVLAYESGRKHRCRLLGGAYVL